MLKALISVSRLSEADPLAIHLKSPDAIDAELARSRPVREFVRQQRGRLTPIMIL